MTTPAHCAIIPAHGEPAMSTTALKQPATPEPLYDADDQEARREMLRRAQHENDLEGCPFPARFQPLLDAYIRGDIDGDQYTAQCLELIGVPSREETLRRVRAGEKVPGYN
jgi:Antitoxin VbhA